MPKATTNAPSRALGSSPPTRARISIKGSVQARSPRTGTSRAASFPSTISALERSVTSMWVSVPRARSRQIEPAVAAGAASKTRVNCMPTNAEVKQLAEHGHGADRARSLQGTARIPDHQQRDQEEQQKPRASRNPASASRRSGIRRRRRGQHRSASRLDQSRRPPRDFCPERENSRAGAAEDA